MEDCHCQGIKLEKRGAYGCVTKVQEFFFLRKSFDGVMYPKQSDHKVVVSEKQSIHRKSFSEDEIGKFCDSRCDEGAAVISCDEAFAKEIMTSLSEHYLVVDHVDLNSKSFSRELAKLFLCESSFSLFMETTNLSKAGLGRIQAITQHVKSLFDNRLRLILYGKPSCESLSEKRFLLNKIKVRIYKSNVCNG